MPLPRLRQLGRVILTKPIRSETLNVRYSVCDFIAKDYTEKLGAGHHTPRCTRSGR